MTLDEAIINIEEIADGCERRMKVKVCAHRQVAKWLKELKQLREQTKWIPVSYRMPEDGRPVLIYAWDVHYVIARYGSFMTENGYKDTWVTADAWNGNTEIKHEVIAWCDYLSEPFDLHAERVQNDT